MKSIAMIATACFCMLIAATAVSQSINKKSNIMEADKESIESINREVVRRIYVEALNQRNLELLREIVSDEYAGIAGGHGPDGFSAPVKLVLQALPDAQWKIQELIAEESKVVVRWKLEGTHLGDFQHVKATRRKVVNEGAAIYTLENGKVIGSLVMTDRLGFLQSLGALPADLSALAVRKPTGKEVNFIDKFFVPAVAKDEFHQRVKINRDFIRALPGFIEDQVYEYLDNDGNLICITIALWESHDAVGQAKIRVQAEYKRQGFDPAAMMERLGIVMDRGTYAMVKN
jgi:predicted ester cyclase